MDLVYKFKELTFKRDYLSKNSSKTDKAILPVISRWLIENVRVTIPFQQYRFYICSRYASWWQAQV